MKKISLFLLFTALFMSSVLHASGRFGSAPESSGGYPLPPEYGGLFYSTSSFTTNASTVAGSCEVVGVLFSTGINGDYVSIYDTTGTAVGVSLREVARVYNLSNSTASVGSAAPLSIAGGWSPICGSGCSIHIYQNLVWAVSTRLYNMVTLLYNKE